MKQSLRPFLTDEHPELLLARVKGSVGLEEYAATLHAAIENDARLQANMHLLSEYLENKMYFLWALREHCWGIGRCVARSLTGSLISKGAGGVVVDVDLALRFFQLIQYGFHVEEILFAGDVVPSCDKGLFRRGQDGCLSQGCQKTILYVFP